MAGKLLIGVSSGAMAIAIIIVVLTSSPPAALVRTLENTQKAIPIIGITEKIQPANLSFQDWMNSELKSLQPALNSKSQG